MIIGSPTYPIRKNVQKFKGKVISTNVFDTEVPEILEYYGLLTPHRELYKYYNFACNS